MEYSYAIVRELPGLDFDRAVEAIVPLLMGEGFGVLT